MHLIRFHSRVPASIRLVAFAYPNVSRSTEKVWKDDHSDAAHGFGCFSSVVGCSSCLGIEERDGA